MLKSISNSYETNRNKPADLIEDENDDPENYSLLQLFVESPWEKKEIKDLPEWLKFKNVEIDDRDWQNSWACRNQLKYLSRKDSVKVQIISELKNILPILIKSNEDVNYKDENKQTILHVYIANNESNYRLHNSRSKVFGIIESLIARGASVNIVDRRGKTPLHIAAETDKLEIVKLMLDFFYRVNTYDENGNTVLHSVLNMNFDKDDVGLDIVRSLLSKNASINRKNKAGKTPVHIAAETGKLEILKLMLEFLTNVDVCDNNGDTIMHSFIGGKSEEEHLFSDIVKILLKKGANLNKKNKKGLTPLSLAVNRLDVKLLEFFKTNNAYFNVLTNNNENLLLLACKNCHYVNEDKMIIDTIDFLIKQGCNINIKSRYRLTPLHYAAHHDKLAEKLIELGAEINCQSNKKETPLHRALKNMKTALFPERVFKSIVMLLRANANCNAIDFQNRTALDIAIDNHDTNAVELILEFGGKINNYDFNKLSVIYCKNICQTAKIHAEKMIAIGFPVGKLMEFYMYNEYPAYCNHDEYESVRNRDDYLEEVEKMKIFMIDDEISIYEFLHMNWRRQQKYVEFLVLNDLHTEFPIYANFILSVRNEILRRKDLLEPAKIGLYRVANMYLPDICVERIFSYLDNWSLQDLIDYEHLFSGESCNSWNSQDFIDDADVTNGEGSCKSENLSGMFKAKIAAVIAHLSKQKRME